MAIDYNKRPSTPADEPAAAPAGSDQPGAVSLSKVTLTKSAPTVSLAKSGAGQVRVNLSWTARTPGSGGGGFLRKLTGGGGGQIDLDLACLWEFTDGSKGVVQALGNSYQAPTSGAPIVRLDQDDRSGSSAGGENLFIDASRAADIRRILVFTFIYEGTPNWAEANATVTLVPAAGPQIEVHLDEPAAGARSCAIALIENQGGELVVRREVNYIKGGQDKVDQAYDWGMNWSPGRK